jgi:hypothetical protein
VRPSKAPAIVIAKAEIEHRIRFPHLYGIAHRDALAMADNYGKAVADHMLIVEARK